MALETLSSELQAGIMLAIPDIAALHSLIQASPRFLQVFLDQKALILSALARILYPPTVFRDAWHAARATSTLKQPDRDTVQKFVFNRRCDKGDEDKIFPDEMSILLIQSSYRLENFIRNFTQYTQEMFVKQLPAVRGGALVKLEATYALLSKTERARMQRAFLAVEIHGLLFPLQQSEKETFTPQEQSRFFFSRYQTWQMEEIACVVDYLVARLNRVARDVENDWLSFAVERSQIGMLNMSAEAAESMDLWEDEERFWFSSKANRDHELYMHQMLRKGLGFLRTVFHATGCEQIRMMTDSSYRTAWPSTIVEVFEAEPEKTPKYLRQSKNCHNGVRLAFEGDDQSLPNLGWLWANQYTDSPLAGFRRDQRSRNWGYVFWDKKRLDASGVIKLNAQEMRNNHARSKETLSVEERYNVAMKVDTTFVARRHRYHHYNYHHYPDPPRFEDDEIDDMIITPPPTPSTIPTDTETDATFITPPQTPNTIPADAETNDTITASPLAPNTIPEDTENDDTTSAPGPTPDTSSRTTGKLTQLLLVFQYQTRSLQIPKPMTQMLRLLHHRPSSIARFQQPQGSLNDRILLFRGSRGNTNNHSTWSYFVSKLSSRFGAREESS